MALRATSYLLLALSFLFVASYVSAFEGDLTFYFPESGITACGTRHTSSESIAALSFTDFPNPGNPNNSPLCQMCARIRGSNGASAVVRIRDRCAGCQPGDIDVTTSVFQVFAPLAVGRIRVSWDFVECSGGGSSNYCGTSYQAAMACQSRCPGGLDGECPAGQRCFASVPCP